MLKETGVDWLLAELIKKPHVRQNIVFIECYKKTLVPGRSGEGPEANRQPLLSIKRKFVRI
jgi:hypothetical protein